MKINKMDPETSGAKTHCFRMTHEGYIWLIEHGFV